MDRALWITWYDLPDASREAHLAWAHGTYIPGVLARPGVLWAAHYATLTKSERRPIPREDTLTKTGEPAVAAGEQFMLLVGAADAHAFADPSPSAWHASLPPESRTMLAQRERERLNIMVEVARIEGPAAKGYAHGMMPAPCIQLGTYNSDFHSEEDMLAWYAQWRMAALAKFPGCVRTRRLASVVGWAKHAIFYEFVSLDARNEFFATHEEGQPEMSAWGNRVVKTLIHAPGSPNLARRIWPAVREG